MERCYFDLSEPQKSIWLTHQVYDEMNHSVTVDVLFRDKADLAAAQRAVNALYLYNQILRAELTDTDGVPKQFFHAYEEGKAYAVIRAFSNPDAYKKWAEEYALQKMGDTLCEISVVDAGTEFGFLIKASHMIIDGMSAVLLLTRLKQYYNAYCLGGEVADTEYRYQDFLERECAYYQDSAGLSRDREYWQKKIAEIDSPTIVSTNNSESVRSQRLLIPLSPDMENSLKRFCEEKGVSEFGVLLSCFALCVSAHFRTDITTIICTILNRVGVKENKTPGMFVNTLPLVLDCARESVTGLSAPEYIKTIQQEFYRASRHFRYSYNHILGEYYQLRGRRELSDITFSYQTFDALSSGDYAREEFAPSWYFCGTQTNSLSFHARREPKEGMKLIFEYQEEKFSEEDIRLFSAHLLESLHSLFANPGQKMADLDMVSARERERILRDFNDTRADYPEDKTMVDLFEGQVRRTPENIALKFLGQTMSYTELNAKANRIAFRLKELGIRPGDHVAILAERRMEIIAGILATLKAGAAYVPIDPGYPAERIRYVLEDSAAGVLLTCQAAAPAGTEIPVLDLCEAGAYAAARENPPCVNSPDDLAYIIYTSGTTGRPKGVMIEHRGVVNLWKRLAGKDPRETDTVLQFSSLSFDVSVYEMLLSLMFGASLCLIPGDVIQDTKAFEQYVADHGVTIAALPPAYAAQIDLKGYRRIITAGSPAIRETVVRANALGVEFVNEYGPTEVTVVSNNWDSLPGTPVPAVIPIGRSQMNKQSYILNGLRLCGIGVPGELCIAGAGLARGYLNQPELTAEKFIRNPFGEGRMYRTGDLARWTPEGNIEYLGRIDEQVKIRGYRIELGEIESVLRKQPGVADAAVVVRIIGADESLCAYIVPERMRDPDMQAIREGLKKELPEYMLPAFMTQVELLPLNRNGKLDKGALPEPDALSGRAYTAPETEMEQTLVGVFEQTLGISPIGIDDSFFTLGGHSLKATMLVNRIEECTGVRLPLRTVFRSPTPRMLAREMEAPPQSGYEPIPEVEQKESYAMSSAQKRLFILEQIAEESVAYHLPSAIEVRGGLDPEQIQSAVSKLLMRHEALRTRFALIDGEAVQIIADEADYKIEYEETELVGNEEMRKFIRPFDLGQAPLMRLKLIKERSGSRYILLFDIHHIIADALTINILTEEFSRLYNGEDLQPLKRQYKNYSEWMRKRDLSAQKDYWMKVFAEEAPVLDLRTDYPRPQAQSFEGSTVSARLGREERESIERINRENGTTTFMTLLAAFMVELHKYSRQEDIVVGVPLSGRVHKDTETMMGMFVNTLALRGCPSAGKPFTAFLAEIKEHTLGVLENQEYPFEQLIEDVLPRRDMSRNPLFDVMFAMRTEGTGALRLGDAELRALDMTANTAKFDLTLQVEETEGGYSLELEYCSDLYTEASASAMLEHFRHLLRSIIANPGAMLSELEMTSLPERERILSEFNDTSAEFAMNKTVVDLFEEQVRRTPLHTALKFEEQTMTYAELNAKANRLAYRLKELGISRESKVALITERGMEMVVGVLGVIKAGGAYVPIDPAYPADRIRYMLEDSAVSAALTYQSALPEGMSVRELDLGDEGAYAAATGNLPRVNKPNDLIYVIYTSGTTGKPKGVMIEHRGVVNLRKRLERNRPCETDTILQFASISFDAATYEMAMALLFGGALCLIPNAVIQDLKAFEKYIEAHGVTMALLPPAYATQTELKPYRRIITGGSAANRETVIRADSLGVDFTNEYGPTEVTVTASNWDYPAGSRVPAVIPIGRPIENTRIYMMNGSELCGIGVPGELHIAGAGLARGYLNQPELTAERFITNLYGEGRLYRSGDLARWLPDGNIEYLGRIDEQVKIRGYRIELGEIESVLRKQPGVADAAAVTRIIGGEDILCAYIAAGQGADPDIPAIRERLAKELPDYMIPVFITQMDALPFNRSGKLDKRALPEPDAMAGRAYTAPETEMERITVQVFEEILALSPIGIHDSFFALGGHSLRATVAVNRIETYTGIRLPLRAIFSSPTPFQLAKELEALGKGVYRPIPKAAKKEYYAMSSAQKRLFILEQMDSESTLYHMPALIEVTGALDPARIQKAMDGLVRRHEALRTSFALLDNEAVQIIAEEAFCELEYEEREIFPLDEIAAFLRPFDLGKAPLLRAKLIKEIRRDRYLLLFDMHHIIADGMTMNILISDFSRLYEGEAPDPPELQFKDYSEWMRSADLSAQRAFWMNVFAEKAPILDMVTDYPRPQTQSYQGAQVSAQLNREQKAAIGKINRENETTVFMTLLAVWMVELHKYSRQEDIVVGAPISGRVHKDTEAMMGMFVNTLAMRGRPTGEKSFIEFLAEMKEYALGAYENQIYPFEDLVEEAETRRDMSRNPMFDVMFVVQNMESSELRLGDAILRVREIDTYSAQFDLTLQVRETEEGYNLSLEYCSDLFTVASAEAILGHFVTLLDAALANPGAKIADLDMISGPEREKTLTAFNDTSAEYQADKTIVDLFEEQVLQTPENIALKFEGQTMTYAALNAKANRLAYRLRELGIKPDDPVALMAERGMEMIVGILGTIKAGGAYVPVDPDYPEDRIRYMLEDSAPKAILTCKVEPPAGSAIPILDLLDQGAYAAETGNPPHVNSPNDLIYIIYTSGTTGRPKGAMIEHRGVVNLRKRMERDTLRQTDTVLQFASLSFDAATLELASSLLFGGALCLLPRSVIQDNTAFEDYVRQHEVNVAILTPGFASQIDLRPYRRITTGGANANRDIILRSDQLGIDYTNEYGPTEATVVTSAWDHRRGAPVPFLVPIGRPIENTQIYILNGFQLCGIGVPGELCIAGAGLARGYLNQPELTAEKFVPNPFGEGRMYRSGDLGRWLPDGNIEYLGRIDEQVKIRGYRIELGEIESVLRKQPGVADAAVVTRNIGGDEILCAYFTAKQGEDPDKPMILEGLRKELPEYMLPAFMTLIPALPLNRNGKLDKQALPEPDMLARRAYTAPETDMERAVVEAFEEILGVSPIGTEDSFFDLGGHSLRATVAVNMLEKATGIRLPLRLLFAFPTASMLAKELEAMGRDGYKPIPKAAEKESYAMSSAQKRLFVLDQIDSGSTVYHIPAAMEAAGKADRDRIRTTMDELILRHEALRTSFALIDGEAVQRIGKAASCEVEYAEIESYSEEELEKFIRPFDLGKAPLIRLKVLQERGGNRYILLFDIHHIIADGMSMRILTEEFSKLYGGETLKAQELQYKDYSEWMRGRDLAAQKAYWMNVFAEEAPVLDLAADYPRPQIQSYRGAEVYARLHKEQKAGIERINKENGTTTFMTLLAAFMVMLHKYSRQEDIVVGAPISGRMHRDTEAMMGMFVNTLAFRGYPSANKSFTGFLAEIKDHALSAYENQEYPFEKLVEDLDTRRDMSRNPLFDVMFSMQNNEKPVLQMGEAELRALEMRTGTAKFDLSLQAEETDEGYDLSLEYSSDIYTEATASAMLEHFVNLVASVTAKPGAAIAALEMTSEAERDRICTAFNDTYAAYPGNKTAVDLFEDQVRRTPENIALKFEGQSMTYAALNAKANRLAYKLKELGIAPESKVALLTARGMEMVVGILGTIKAGGAYVPVDPGYPEERIRYMLEDSASSVVLTCRTKAPEGIGLPLLDLETEACYADKEENPPHVNGPDDLVYIIYTSGTTGKPKGVMIEHHGVVNMTMMYNAACALNGGDTLLQYANMSFDETVADVFATLSSGASLCLTPADTVYDFEALHEYMNAQQVTVSSLTPKVIRELRLEKLPSLRLLESGGEAGNIDNLKELAKKIRILNTYGPTESTVNATMTEVGPDCTLLPIGKPVINTQVYILSGMELCGIGVPGELCIAGGSLARGYLNQRELTEEKFIHNPYGEGRLYRSGDLARWLPDGNIDFLGRMDEQVKLRGFRIELAEIESLLRKQPGVTDAAVVLRKAGEDTHLCAYLAAEQGRELDLAVIRAALANALPEYMIPAFMTQMGALPLNRSGKLDQRALPEPDALAGRSYTAPRTEAERSVIAAFEEILGISPIGIEDSFFEIGGDSIKLIRVVSKLREQGYHFTVSDFMRLRTVERICAHYRNADKAVAWAPPPRNGSIPGAGDKDGKMINEMLCLLREYGNNYKKSEGFSACQALFMHKMFLSDYARTLVNILTIHCDADSALSALQAVLSSQGALRTRYNSETDCFEEYAYNSAWEIPLLDASQYTGDLDACIASLAESASTQGFPLDQMLLSRLLLIKTDDENCLFVSVMHHSIWDGVSQELLRILINESLENGSEALRSYSYIQYCQSLEDQDRDGVADGGAEADIERYTQLAQEASALPACRNPACRADFRMKLNEAQKDKLANSPIESTMMLLADLMYGDYCTRLPAIPYAVLRHNRDEGNGGMLGMTLRVDLALFDAEKKRQIAEMENRRLLSGSDERAASGISVPVINYLGIFKASEYGEDGYAEEPYAEEPYIEIGRSESGIQDVYMEYYVQDDTLNACILGLSLERGAIEEAIRKF